MSCLFSYEAYTAIIGDIIKSRKIENRKLIQEKLKQVLERINEKFKEDIASKFKIILGDEFQGLLKNREHMMEILYEIEAAVVPVGIRFGVGIGTINTEINFEDSSENDGTAYHRARSMIEKIKVEGVQYAERKSDIMICSGDENIDIDNLINSLLSVCTALKSKWTQRQCQVVDAYFSSGQNQYKAAELLGIGQPSVNKALNGARFYTYKSALDTINAFLNKNMGG